MQLLLRKYTQNSQGDLQLHDSELAAEKITLGSAANCTLQLQGNGIQAQHAQLGKTPQGIAIAAFKGGDFRYNNQTVKQALLQVGDQLEFEGHRLEVINAPAGFDIALQWQAAEHDASLLVASVQTQCKQSAFNTRRWSWWLAAGILLFAGLLPVADYVWRSQSPITPETPINARNAEQFWQSGPLHSAHRLAIGNQCQSCHQKPFEQVTDTTCKSCHAATAEHVLAGHQHSALFEGLACQSCHKEHNEPAQLINQNDALCTQCHQALEPKISGFSAQKHPEFQLSLLQPDILNSIGSLRQDWHIERKSAAAKNTENSHLKFSHQVHLDPTKVRNTASDKTLECSACHSLSADKEHFVPITMEQQCSGCHSLSFDPAQPQKQLPHGVVEGVYPALEAHYLALAFHEGNDSDLPPRRLPAKTPQSQSCKGDVACAQQQAIAETNRQFAQKGCVTCHQVTELSGTDARSRWQVLPVRLNQDWYPAAHFNHQRHLTQQGKQGDALCLSCHAAKTSTQSADVLIPAQNTCTNCHGDAAIANKVTLQCASCHAFHPSEQQRQTRQLQQMLNLNTLSTPSPQGKE